MIRLGFIGAGALASVLATGLSARGYPVVAVSSLNRESAQSLAKRIYGSCALPQNQQLANSADLVFITTPDDAIPTVVAEIQWRPGQSVVHCSGADSADVLSPAREAGAHIGVFHPLQTVTGGDQENFKGITFFLEAEEPLLATLKEMATALGGHWRQIAGKNQVLYHTSAVLVCNYLVTLVKLATDLWRLFDIPQEESVRELIPLIKGTINNIETTGIPECLTGPIARGDTGTISKHLATLNNLAPELTSTYCELGLKTIPVALAKGSLNDVKADEIKNTLIRPKSLGKH
jgi:predicted short-subunit dehydrogenase-like oxidoreductase (DUF2520 family)